MSKVFSFRTIRNAVVMCAAVVAMCLMSQNANAQGCGYGGGGYGGGYGGYGGGYGGYGSGLRISVGGGYGGYRGYGGGYGYKSYRPRWHDTSHYDYTPGRNVRHGNHSHYLPGDTSLHRTGHWHR